jgi:hypothetical protein
VLLVARELGDQRRAIAAAAELAGVVLLVDRELELRRDRRRDPRHQRSLCLEPIWANLARVVLRMHWPRYRTSSLPHCNQEPIKQRRVARRERAIVSFLPPRDLRIDIRVKRDRDLQWTACVRICERTPLDPAVHALSDHELGAIGASAPEIEGQLDPCSVRVLLYGAQERYGFQLASIPLNCILSFAKGGQRCICQITDNASMFENDRGRVRKLDGRRIALRNL